MEISYGGGNKMSRRKIILFTCEKYHAIVPIFVHFWFKNLPNNPYELVIVTGTGKIDIDKHPQITIVYQGEDRGYASNAITYLSSIQDREVLLLQEDFILHSARPEMIERAFELCTREDIGCVRLGGVPGPDWQFTEPGGEGFGEIDKANADWVFSMQAAVWKKDVFLSLIEWGNSPWQSEHKGTDKARKRPERFLCSEARVLDYEQYCTLGENIETEVKWVEEHWDDPIAGDSPLTSDTVTAHLMIRNEEYWIGFVLENLTKRLRNILVFDTGSTDKTIEIVKSFPVTLVEKGPLSPMELMKCRNEMLEMTQTPWAWQIDGDELYPDKSIKTLLKQNMPAGKKVGFTQLLDVGWDGENFRAYLPFARVAILAREVRFEDTAHGHGYPFEMPDLFFDTSLYHYFPDSVNGFHLHHLLRSSRDEDVYLRVEKRHQFSMMDREIPLGEILKIKKPRRENPYFK